MIKPDFTYLSLGCGVQSSALLVLGATGVVPKPDLAVFADTGDEPSYVYNYLELLTEYAASQGIPVSVAKKGILSEDYLAAQTSDRRGVSLPLFIKNVDGAQGLLMRQCTREYKVEPIEKLVRAHLGYKPRQRIKERVVCQIGISVDEAMRMKPSRVGWVRNTFPLVDLHMTRRKCSEIVVRAGLPEPKKSACVFCPYHSNSYWKAMKDEHPDEFWSAVDFDAAIRKRGGRKEEAFLHRSLMPLDVADLDPMKDQVDMFGNECEGLCGL